MEMKLGAEYYNKIVNGEKIIEGRLFDDKRKKLKVGSTITFIKMPEQQEKVSAKVVSLKVFKSFNEMCVNVGANALGFNNLIPNEVAEIYHGIYSEHEEKELGVLAIGIKVVK